MLWITDVLNLESLEWVDLKMSPVVITVIQSKMNRIQYEQVFLHKIFHQERSWIWDCSQSKMVYDNSKHWNPQLIIAISRVIVVFEQLLKKNS